MAAFCMKYFPDGDTTFQGGGSMVKGITKQVIVLHSPDPKLFEQAIFIIKDEALEPGVTDAELIKEAQRLIRKPVREYKKRSFILYGWIWACGGALLTGLVWLLTAFL